MNSQENAYAVILAGGGGTRLWPKSRKSFPKHFIQLLGKDTMLQTTYKRIESIFPKSHILVITNKIHVDYVYSQLPHLPKENVIAEPFPNNTALAMGVAAAFVHARSADGVVSYFAADHLIEDMKKLKEAVLASIEIAANHPYIVAIGIKPTFAHTGLGYIRVGQEIGKVKVDKEVIYAFKVRGFKEKPNQSTAQSFLASGEYLWNANLYCWSTKTIFEAFEKYNQSIFKGLQKLIPAINTKDQEKVLEKTYTDAENISIDYAVSEKAKNIVVVPGEFYWNDVGSWQVVYDMEDKDPDGLAIVGKEAKIVNIGSKDCLVEANGRVVALVGVKDLIVVDTEDALLICSKEKAEDVKKAVEKLKETSKDKYL